MYLKLLYKAPLKAKISLLPLTDFLIGNLKLNLPENQEVSTPIPERKSGNMNLIIHNWC